MRKRSDFHSPLAFYYQYIALTVLQISYTYGVLKFRAQFRAAKPWRYQIPGAMRRVFGRVKHRVIPESQKSKRNLCGHAAGERDE